MGGQCVSRRQREDERWAEEVRHRQEQERQACEQEGKRGRQESIQENPRLDRCCAECQEGTRFDRLRGSQEGLCVVQEGQGVLHEVRPSQVKSLLAKRDAISSLSHVVLWSCRKSQRQPLFSGTR